ncbi:hypothetical protein HYW59_04105 [Candidatus Kaiserbacteria bacterium]|nr:hypothetical protein [Candidatus Kaiserbacteria bacterium]
MEEHNNGKMRKTPKLVRGERGVSILGALVVALMLGAGAVATFELATPPLSSVSSDSQVAALTAAQIAAQKKAAAQKAELDKKIERQCTFLRAPLYKPEESRGGGETSLEKFKGTIEKDTCVSAFYMGKDSKGKPITKCFGLKSKIQLNREPNKIENGKRVGIGKVVSVPDKGVPKGTCETEVAGEDGKKLSPEDLATIYKGSSAEERKAISNSLGTPGTNLDKAQRDVFARVLGEDVAAAKGYLGEVAADHGRAIDAIRKYEKDNGCTVEDPCDDATYEDLLEKESVLANKRAEALKEYNDLRDAQKSLADVAAKGPPTTKTETPAEKEAREATEKAEAEKRSQQTFNDKGGGGGGGDGGPKFTLPSSAGPQSFGGRQPPAGNGVPQPAGTCSPSVICGNNTLYSRNNQCVDQVMQQCQYGCSGTQCAQAPQQGQGCQQAPAQPDPSGCQSGSWRPTYTGACVSSWQCVPTGSGGTSQITAALSCQPQIADVGMTIAITYSCSSGTSEGSGFDTGGAQTGSTTVTIANPPVNANVATYALKCTEGSVSATKQCNVQIAKPAIVLVANPKAVQSGKTSAIGWVTSGMQACVISSPDLPTFTEQQKNTTNVNGTVTTPALTSGATFVLKCTTLGGGTKEASTVVTIQ